MSSPRPASENLCDLHNEDKDTLSMDCKCKSLRSSETDGTVEICLCAMDLVDTTWLTHLSLHNNGHVDDLQELHLENCGYLSLQQLECPPLRR